VDDVNLKPICQIGLAKPYNADLGGVYLWGPILRTNCDPDFARKLVGQLVKRQRRGQTDDSFRSPFCDLDQRRMQIRFAVWQLVEASSDAPSATAREIAVAATPIAARSLERAGAWASMKSIIRAG
jgi:hypothetical protein